MCEPHVPRLNGAEPATQRRPHRFTLRFLESSVFRTDLLTAHEPPSAGSFISNHWRVRFMESFHDHEIAR